MTAPDLILTGGHVLTMDPARPFARDVAIAGGRILAVGDDLARLAGPSTRSIALRGRAAMPGLIDSHTHGLWGACRDLFEVFPGLGAPLQAVLDGIAARAARTPPGDWIIAGPWRPFDRPGLGARPAEMLDRLAPDHPVVVKDVSQHNLWVNSAALRLAGIDRHSPDPAGGQIERDSTGAPTGILIETAGAAVQRFLEPTAAQLDRAVQHMAGYFHGLGITGFKEPMAFAAELATYAKADRAGALDLHVGAHLTRFSPFSEDWVQMESLAVLRAAHQSPHLHTGFAKLFLDGVPIARTAAFLAPYPGSDPTNHDPEAMLLLKPDRLNAEVTALDAAGYVVKMHAVGDRAVQAGLDAIAAARAANGASGLRHEIAHANFIAPADLPRFAALGAVAEVSPKLWMPNPVTAGQRAVLGDARVDQCHPIRSLLAHGAEVIYGSDWPAAALDANPWTGLAGMISRRDPTGTYPGTVAPDEAIPLAQALPLFTRNAARALGLEGQTGQITPGASADLIVLARPLDRLSPEDIAGTRPEATLFEGRLVHGAV
ncbi:amidohydrolase [Tabrizicola oligotrophica]|uniref:Amidohydrolase n=1 Tax=Tabrizicola oligotrophica TaxID=2710650 RepID=A0A6M0QVZ1_9RHOB|nr:amidohydrolase [Tabrizicola oligotrophica]NEY91656.1 amidohydrolase [Tabrizicola oligotrophica]